MVQRKVVDNKQLAIQPNTLKTETKPTFENHDSKSKGADLKSIKMKKSRSIKRANVDMSLPSSPQSHHTPRQPRKPPPVVTPIPKKPSYCNISPNYMKSTSSFEARKEKTIKVCTVSSTSKLHRVARLPLAKTSSFKKGRTLTRTTTCSSTLKDSKFPSYLELKPGATESEGNSVLRVCSYNYCSLNGYHHHNSVPPLKRFMYSRRMLLNSQKVSRAEVSTPRKANGSGKLNEDFFVRIYVLPDTNVATQVSESLSDGPCSVIDSQDDLDQSEDTTLSDFDFCPTDDNCRLRDFQNLSAFQSNLEVDSSPSVENSDMEWDEGQIFLQSDYDNDEGKSDLERRSNAGEYLEDFHDYPPYFYDEIVECISFSDVNSLPDSESTQTGEKDIDQPVMVEEKVEMKSGPNNEVPEEESTLENEKGGSFSGHTQEITESQKEDLDSYRDSVITDGDESNEESYVTGELGEENVADTGMEERKPSDETRKDILQITENLDTFSAKEGISSTNNKDQDSTDCSEAANEAYASRSFMDDQNFLQDKDVVGQKENEANNCVRTRSANLEENDTIEVKLHLYNNTEVKASVLRNVNSTEGVDASPATKNKMQEGRKSISNNGASDCNQELLDSCNKLKGATRCRKEDEDIDEEREFNPRGPNFLDFEPGPEEEKVALRHQEADGRRNAEDWMLDYALQKTVNQLTPARKKKVELLVEAFEAVLLIDTHV